MKAQKILIGSLVRSESKQPLVPPFTATVKNKLKSVKSMFGFFPVCFEAVEALGVDSGMLEQERSSMLGSHSTEHRLAVLRHC